MTALTAPPRVWWRPLGRDERLWAAVAVLWGLVMFATHGIWQRAGSPATPTEAYRMEPARFVRQYEEFVRRYQVGEEGGVPVVEPPPGSDVYLLAVQFQFRPILRLRQGETYTLHLSSADVQHGLSLQPVNLNLQVLPGYVHVVRLTPREPGVYALVCNEYCGLGHHVMTGRLIVVEGR